MRATLCLLVVIDNFDIYRPGRAIGPLKADSPLVVDADAVLALPIAQGFFQKAVEEAARKRDLD